MCLFRWGFLRFWEIVYCRILIEYAFDNMRHTCICAYIFGLECWTDSVAVVELHQSHKDSQ